MHGIGRAPLVLVGERIRHGDVGDAAGNIGESVAPEERGVLQGGIHPDTAGDVACHVEAGIPGVLVIEHARPDADHPLAIRGVGDADARREVVAVRLHQRVAQPAIAEDADLRPADGNSVVRVAAAGAFANELRITGLVGHIGCAVFVWHEHGKGVPSGVIEGGRDLVAQPQRESQFGCELPGIVQVKGPRISQEFGACDRDRCFRLVQIAQQEVAKGIAACLGDGVLGGVRLKRELPARELIAHLIVVLAPELSSETECVLAANPGKVVDKLQRIVVVRVRAFGVVSQAAVVDQRHVGNAPLHGIAGLQPGDSDLGHDVLGECQVCASGIEEARVAEAKLIHRVGSEGSGIGAHVLLEVGDRLRTVQSDTGIRLVFIAPAVPSGPLRPGRFHKVHPK